MSLQRRLSLLVVAVALLGLLLFGALAYGVFVRLQDAQLSSLLERELARVQAIIESPEVDERLLPQEGDLVFQLVSLDGTVILPPFNQVPLPLFSAPNVSQHEGRTMLISSRPWRLGDTDIGSIRLGLDMSLALAARRNLLVSLIVSGLVITLATALAGIYQMRRVLAPLRGVARSARHIDPKAPALAPYRGPKDEVADLAEALHDALDTIRSRQAAERAFLSEIAHELAAPLTLVAAHLDALAKSQGGDPQVRAARAAAHELLYTSQDLLTLARGELERPLEFELVSLAEVVKRIATEYPGVKLRLEAKPTVAGNPERLAQVVRNLVRNAVQASGDPCKVSLDLKQEDDEVRLEVCDEGPGFREEDLPRLFERFYSRRGGAGLGLGIAKSIIEGHQGRIEVRSSPGQGSVFSVVLPSLEARLEA